MKNLERCAMLMVSAHDVPLHVVLRANTKYLHHCIFDEQFCEPSQYWMWVYHAFCKVWYESKKSTKIQVELAWGNPHNEESVVFKKKHDIQRAHCPQEFFRLLSESSPDMVEKPRKCGVDWEGMSIHALEYYLECEKENDASPEPFSVEDLL